MIAKPIGNNVIDQWHLDCWEAEQAQQDAIDALNNCPLDAENLHELQNEVNATTFKLNEIYERLPYSDPPKRTLSEAKQSLKRLDVKQAAKCINRYLHSRPNIRVVSYDAQFELDRYEWTVEKLVRYIVKGDVISHRAIIGKIWIEQPADGTMISGQKIRVTLGYEMADGETKIINGYLLADVWRGCVNACADLADKISDAEATDKSLFVNRDKVKEHWKKIPNIGNDMQIVKKWNDGWSAKQIAVFFEYDLERKVYKRLDYLRKKFPTEVLTSKVRKQYGIPRKM